MPRVVDHEKIVRRHVFNKSEQSLIAGPMIIRPVRVRVEDNDVFAEDPLQRCEPSELPT